MKAHMSYLVLARKWRPRTFSQLVGQEHINKALTNSLNQQRLHHAYLFTGTRGVGKTSVARLLAKALNCEQGISAEPCLHCDACQAIEQGRFIDLIEIDGASRTRVEDTRELLENVQYKPTNGRFKIYLIDEVHMLSQHSFNALLKTLEEPPEHVKFLLATTDPQKLPVTVLSRCLQFCLKHLAPEIISRHLQSILKEEQLSFDVEAIDLLAKAAKGSMRDGLSLLDQAIASSDNKLSAHVIKGILGYTQQDYAIQLLLALARLDANELIHICRKIANEGGYFSYVLDELLEYLHEITIAQSLASDNPLIKPRSEIQVLAQQFSPEDTQLFYQIAIKGTKEIHWAPTLAIGFEMTVLRMLIFRPSPKTELPPLAYESTFKKTAPPIYEGIPSSHQVPKSILLENKEIDDTKEVLTLDLKPSTRPTPGELVSPKQEDWPTILTQLKLTGLAFTAADNTEFVAKSGHEIQLRVAKGHLSLFTPTVTNRIEQALQAYYKEPINIALSSDEQVQSSALQKQIAQNLRQQDAEMNLQNDAFFQQLKQEFSAELVKNSIVPVKDEL